MATLPELIQDRPKLRYIFTGGKGGVGKTIAAAGLAYHYASQGGRVLLAFLNPLHSPSHLFGPKLSGGQGIGVEGAEGVDAGEGEASEGVQRHRHANRGRAQA